MFIIQTKYRSSLKPGIFTVFLFFCCNAYPQNSTGRDTIRNSQIFFIHFSNSISLFGSEPQHKLLSGLIAPKIIQEDKNLVFFDSLKVKASKNRLTKKLYDFVIIAHDTIVKKQITGTSDANYLKYKGIRIRNINIQRLNVFGTNINNPTFTRATRADNIFNKTHVNTNERIIRNNLLFHKGDTISPLLLSDNERILRQLPFIDDARIIIVPLSDTEADIQVLTKDVYSLGGSYTYKGLKKGSVSLFEKNIIGLGHELGFEMPYDATSSDSPGLGVHYTINNIVKSFVNLNIYYLNGLGDQTYGFDLSRKLVSSSTKYAGGISIKHIKTKDNLGTLAVPEPLKFNSHDYWLSRSFLIDKESVTRIIIGGRYLRNNVFDRPIIQPDSYFNLANYRMYLGSFAYSVQKYYKTSLIYGYGRTEDIPYGGLLRVTYGSEFNEFNKYRKRSYIGTEFSFGKSNKTLGYFYISTGLATYLDGNLPQQGILSLNMKYFSNLVTFRNNKIRNFINFDYTKGFERNIDESLRFVSNNGFSGFKNDSVYGKQRLTVSLESVLFSPANIYGFRFAFFGFTDFSWLFATNEAIGNGIALAGIGLGIRIRNDNLVFNTFQIRLGFFPNPPMYSKINNLTVSGEQLLRPNNFDSGPPSIIPYR